MTPRTSSTSWPRLAAAVIAGFWLFQLLAVVLNGYLAAVAVPNAYFAWFGGSRRELALGGLQLVSALPVFLLMAAGVLATCRVFRSRTRPFLTAILVGMVLCFAYWTLSFLLVAPTDRPPGAGPDAFAVRAQQFFAVPWWALPSIAAPWLGFLFAAWLLSRRPRGEG
jgi:hypothetical protein